MSNFCWIATICNGLCLLAGAGNSAMAGAEPVRIELRTRVPHQVAQRHGNHSAHAHDHEPGGAALGYADVPIAGPLAVIERVSAGTSVERLSAIHERAALLWFAALWPVLNAAIEAPEEDGFVALFDGKSLEGWEGDFDLWKVEGGSIVGDSPGIKRNQFLATKKRYANFELRLEFKLRGGIGNTGIQFRSERVPGSHEVSGYQADIGEKYWGCLYDESRRKKVLVQAPPELEKVLKYDGWNQYVIRAEGNHVRLWINGLKTVDYMEPDEGIARTGILALQVHSGPALRVEFRKLRIKELPQ